MEDSFSHEHNAMCEHSSEGGSLWEGGGCRAPLALRAGTQAGRQARRHAGRQAGRQGQRLHHALEQQPAPAASLGAWVRRRAAWRPRTRGGSAELLAQH
jgi:hypothetical protein